jgi:hypothetical protein
LAVAGGQPVRGGQRAGAEPQLIVGSAAIGDRAVKHRRDAVGPQVAIPGPVVAGGTDRQTLP